MKLLFSASFCLALLASSSHAFSPSRAFAPSRRTVAVGGVFTTTTTTTARRASTEDELSLEEEVEQLVKAEVEKTAKMSNLRNANGVEYAPWMRISQEDEERIRKMMINKAEARRRRREEESDVSGALSIDSQAQELSGTGLRFKVINGNDVELEWATDSESSTKGFAVKRREAKTDGYVELASYKTSPLLTSKGPDGGVYRYLDEGVAPGGYMYRITECESNGSENDLSQCLVDVQTQEEQRGAIVAAVALVVVAIAAVVAGTMLDPVQY